MNEKKSVWMSVLIAVVVGLGLLAPSIALAEQPPVHIEFIASRTQLEAGQCATLNWHVEGGFQVLLNGIPVKPAGQKNACPLHTQAYELAVDTGVSIEFREIVLHVGGEGNAPAAPKPQQPAPPSPQPQPGVTISFRADRTQLSAGQCTMLRWDVEHAKEVYLDGKGVVGHSSKLVCPASGRTYVLRVLHAGGTTDRKVTIQVNGGGAPAPQKPASNAADLAVTDLYADKLPKGAVWVRVTNHGPATLKNAPIEMKCNAQGQPLGGQKPWQHVESPWLHTVNLKPGQTATFQTKMKVDTDQYSYNVTCSVWAPQGAAFSDPNGANNVYSEAISAQAKPNPGPAPRNADLAVTDLYPTKMRGGQLFARITNRGPATLNGAKAQLACQGAGWKNGNHTAISHSTSVTLTLSHGQTAAFDTGIGINIDQYDSYEMTCTVSANIDDPNPANNSYSELIQ